MGDKLKECKGDIFSIGNFMEIKDPSSSFDHISRADASIYPSNTRI
jgi:hypothetical protein